MKFRLAMLAVILVVTLLGAGLLSVYFSHASYELRAEHEWKLKSRERDWVQRKLQAESAAQARARQREANYPAELARVLGPLPAAVNDPDLDIATMLQRVAQHCAGADARVTVRVEHFTEFTISVALSRRVDDATLVRIGRCALAECAEYVEALQFSQGGVLIGEFDRRAIEAGMPWRELNSATAATLLITPATDVAATQSGAGDETLDSELERNMTEAYKREWVAMKAFNSGMKDAGENLRRAAALQDDAVRLGDIRLREDFAHKQRLLAEAQTTANAARTWLTDPAGAYALLLEVARADEIYTRAELRGVRAKYRNAATAAESLFQRMAQVNSAQQAYLQTMQNHFGRWHCQPDGEKILFDTESAFQAHDAASRPLRESIAAFVAANEQWQRSLPVASPRQ